MKFSQVNWVKVIVGAHILNLPLILNKIRTIPQMLGYHLQLGLLHREPLGLNRARDGYRHRVPWYVSSSTVSGVTRVRKWTYSSVWKAVNI